MDGLDVRYGFQVREPGVVVVDYGYFVSFLAEHLRQMRTDGSGALNDYFHDNLFSRYLNIPLPRSSALGMILIGMNPATFPQIPAGGTGAAAMEESCLHSVCAFFTAAA